ncbi:hypothetical protein PLANPX_1871 [Lacipirellula parvula]|uniref:Uncharacterized protein n=2 Tax=Lacipirellula parvula TaxID=2650471 RepID=A0A5K7XH24_9BACT|nr:hypothetical protein PLANPX_1871 [Lacipirellula parvula]
MYRSVPSIVCFGDDVEFTPAQQEKLNSLLAEDKRGLRSQLANTERQLAELSESKSLTEAEREQLRESLEETRRQLRSKEENEAIEKKKLQKELTTLRKRADEAEAKQRESTIAVALSEAAVAGGAFNPSILSQVLRERTTLTPEGNVVVEVAGKDEDGNDIVERVSPIDAVKRMKAQPDRWGGLFADFVASKAALPTNKNGKVDVTTISTDEFMRLWKTNRSKLDL